MRSNRRRMHGRKIKKSSPAKWKAPNEIFPGASPEFVVNFGWGEGKGWDRVPGLSGGTWKYLGNEAYKGVTKQWKKVGKQIGKWGSSTIDKTKKYLGK